MNFFMPDNIQSVVDGQWINRGDDCTTYCGVGIDSREDLAGRIFIAIRGEQHDGHQYVQTAIAHGASCVIVDEASACDTLSDGSDVLLVDDTRRALGKLAQTYRESWKTIHVIAVTGSAGKTTTKQLIHAVLSTTLKGSAAPKSFNNDIGVPLTLLAAQPDDDYVVVEIGSNAPGEIAALSAIAKPDIAVITMIGHSHLEGLGSIDAVAEEKTSILHYMQPNSLAVLPDDPRVLDLIPDNVHHVMTYGDSNSANFRITARGHQRGTSWFELNQDEHFQLNLHGAHNARNALAAIVVARHLKLPDLEIRRGLVDAEPVAMRLVIQQLGRLRIFNDAYNANPESMAAALDTFAELSADDDQRVLVLGDMLELGESSAELHRELGNRITELHQRLKITHVMLIGNEVQHTLQVLDSHPVFPETTIMPCANADACAKLMNQLRDTDAVLFKASRGIKLERLIDSLIIQFQNKTPLFCLTPDP